MSITDLAEASCEIDAHLVQYQRAGHYYEGDDVSRFVTDVLNEFFKSEDFTGTLNYASIPVDAVADRLQLLSIKGKTDAITQQISDLWNANKMPLRFGQFILDVLKYGEYFITVWPEEAEDSELMDLDIPLGVSATTPLNHKAKIMFADASTTRAFYDDGGELMYVARKWCETDADGKEINRVNLYYSDVIEKYWWFVKDKIETAKPWFDTGQEEWPMENPYGQIPIFHFSTAFPYGQPEHKSLYGVQDALNKIFQTHIASIEYLGFPIIYTLMDETSASGTSDFEFAPIDQNDGDVQDVNRLKNNPGEVWAVRAKSIGQIDPAGSTSFIESLKQYKEIASEISGLPARLFSSTDGQHPGADAVNAADAVLRQRVIDRSILLSEPLKQMVSFALLLAFNIEVDPQDISILWRPQKVEIDAAVITVFEFKLKLGIAPRQILSEMGYTDTEIDQFLGIGEDGKAALAEKEAAAAQKFQQKNADSNSGSNSSNTANTDKNASPPNANKNN